MILSAAAALAEEAAQRERDGQRHSRTRSDADDDAGRHARSGMRRQDILRDDIVRAFDLQPSVSGTSPAHRRRHLTSVSRRDLRGRRIRKHIDGRGR